VTIRPVPLQVQTDPQHGGRWTSLRGGGREWLWHRDEPRRASAVPGTPFADAGGLEECLPTVRGTPDHGDAWSRRWRRNGEEETVKCADFTLTRQIRGHEGTIVADYLLTAEPGYRFVWAAHALLELSERALLLAKQGTPTRIFPEAAACLNRPWPKDAPWIDGPWPAPSGLRLDTLGPDDGRAVGAILHVPDAQSADVSVLDGQDELRMSVAAEGQPVSVALWRNLCGFPSNAPYRSIGVEPMLGAVFDLADAAEGDCAVTPASGEVRWRLTVSASRHNERT
jgi:hypothetical protein